MPQAAIKGHQTRQATEEIRELVAQETLEQRCHLAERLQREAELREKAMRSKLEEATVRRTMEAPTTTRLAPATAPAQAQPHCQPRGGHPRL